MSHFRWAYCCIVLSGMNLYAGDIEQWIHDLGHSQFRSRQLAEQHLEQAGPTILPTLRTWQGKADPEQQERLAGLIRRLEQQEWAELLTIPTYVQLHYPEQPLRQLLYQASKDLGLNLQLDLQRVQNPDRRVKLHLPRLTTWQAYNALLKELQLQESTHLNTWQPPVRRYVFPNLILQSPNQEQSQFGPTMLLQDSESPDMPAKWCSYIGCLRFRLQECTAVTPTGRTHCMKWQITTSGRHSLERIQMLEVFGAQTAEGARLAFRPDSKPFSGQAVSEMVWLQRQGGPAVRPNAMLLHVEELGPTAILNHGHHEECVSTELPADQSQLEKLWGQLIVQMTAPPRKVLQVTQPWVNKSSSLQDVRITTLPNQLIQIDGRLPIPNDISLQSEPQLDLRLRDPEQPEMDGISVRIVNTESWSDQQALEFQLILTERSFKAGRNQYLELWVTRSVSAKLPINFSKIVLP